MSYFSCLLIGPPGAGKTTAASTAPGPVLYLDVDNKLHKMFNMQELLKVKHVLQWPLIEPLAEVKLSRLANVSKDEIRPGGNMIVPRPKGYIKLAEMVDNLVDSKCVINGVKFETVVLDSYTSLQEHLKRLLMAVNQSSTMTQPLYGTFLSNLETMNNTLLSLPANVIIISHQTADKDDLTGEISYKPLIEGQMREKIGKDFEEVYYMEKRIMGDKAIYEMLTVGSSMKACRTSRNLPSRVSPNFKEIYK